MEIAVGIAAGAAIAAAAVLIYGVYLSNLIYAGSLKASRERRPLDVIAESAGDGRISLRATKPDASFGNWRHPGIFWIVSADGCGRIGDIVELGDNYAVREYTPLTATIGDAEAARIDAYDYAGNPQTAHGIAYENVRYASDLGEFPAWRIDGDSRVWAIFVHGRGAHPNESLRILPTLTAAGLTTLCITYRNDEGVPASADGRHWLGLTEWRELEGAVRYALQHGAARIVLYGYSMGGGICLNFLYESALADKVIGVALDSPLLDFEGTLDYAAQALGYPRFITQYGKRFAGVRFGIDWDRMNYLARAAELRAPMLLLHGDADALVPAETSRRLQRARPDIARYVEFAGAGHALSWNADSAKYEKAVRRFLRDAMAAGCVNRSAAP